MPERTQQDTFASAPAAVIYNGSSTRPARSANAAHPDAVTPRAFAPARPDKPVSSDSETIRRLRSQRVRRQIQTWLYDEEAGLDAALDRLARDLGVKLHDGESTGPQPSDQR